MIPLYKLEKLPRTQKLRKIAKVFIMAETRLVNAGAEKQNAVFSVNEFVFFAQAAKMLASDVFFSKEAVRLFLEACKIFETTVKKNCTANSGETALFRRVLNNVKHLLLAETGKEQADWDFTCPGGKLDSTKRQVFKGMCLYLEDIRSPFNIGSIFRTAESFGVEKIYLSPFCADPHHRRAERTAMGCVDIVPWERQDFFTEPQKPPFPVFALETGGTPIDKFSFPRQGLLIAGSEELGVSPGALAAADASLGRVSIPIYGAKASLNVSVAAGIALAAWAEKRL